MFGLGSKSMFVYTNEALIETVKNGVRYFYLVKRGAHNIDIYLLTTEQTDAENQTHISIDIKAKDEHKVHSAIQNKLTYFKNIRFTGLLEHHNKTVIYENEHFFVSPNFNSPHVVIHNVNYPISDFANLKIPRECLGIGLKFKIGELEPLPTRENLLLNEATIAKLNEKWKEVQPALAKFLYEEYPQVFKSYEELFIYGGKNREIKFNGVKVNYSYFNERDYSYNGMFRNDFSLFMYNNARLKFWNNGWKTYEIKGQRTDADYIVMDINSSGKTLAYIRETNPNAVLVYHKSIQNSLSKEEVIKRLKKMFPNWLSDVVVPATFEYKKKTREVQTTRIVSVTGYRIGDYTIAQLNQMKGKRNYYVGLKSDRIPTPSFMNVIWVSKPNKEALLEHPGYLDVYEELKRRSVKNRIDKRNNGSYTYVLSNKKRDCVAVVYRDDIGQYPKSQGLHRILQVWGQMSNYIKEYTPALYFPTLKIFYHAFIKWKYTSGYKQWEETLSSECDDRDVQSCYEED